MVDTEPASGWTVSRPSDPAERDADRQADAVVAGGRPAAATAGPVSGRPSRLIQRHVSFEHRMLGDLPTADLVTVSVHGGHWDEILIRQIRLMDLWRYQPERVTEGEINKLCPWIRTLRLGADGLLVTYGELNALPDYLPDAPSFDDVSPDILLPVLQVIRQEGHNQLTRLLTGRDPMVTFSVTPVIGANGHLEVFAVGLDGTLYHDWQDGNGNWHGWTPRFDNAPGELRSVRPVLGANGHLELFAIDTAGVLHHDWQDASSWQGWTANFNGAPGALVGVSAALGPVAHLETFVIADQGATPN